MDIRIGRRATLVIPARIRRKMGVNEGDLLQAYVNDAGQLVLTPVAEDPRQRLSRAMAGAFGPEDDPVAMIRELRNEWDE